MQNLAPHVLTGFDGSPGSVAALNVAAALAEARGLELRILLAQPLAYTSAAVQTRLHHRADEVLHTAADHVHEKHPGLRVHPHLAWDTPSRALVEASGDAVMMVLGTRGNGPIKSLLLGSVSGSVSAHAQCPVLVVPDNDPPSSGPVVVGVDGSPESLQAAAMAVSVSGGASVELLHAWQPVTAAATATGHGALVVPDQEAIRDEHQELLDGAVQALRAEQPAARVSGHLVTGEAALALSEASATARLVVVGSRGLGGFTGLLLGSVSRSVIQSSSCPVLVVRGAAEGEERAA